MVDRDLAALYEVKTKALNQAVERNRGRFPADFMFQLTDSELENWKSQFVTSNQSMVMGLRKRPRVFTEQGVAMLSGVLRSERAVRVNIEIMRAFVRMRRALAANQELAKRLEKVEKTLHSHGDALGEHGKAQRTVFEEIRGLLAAPAGPRRRIGFR